jgi:hypothetical protein
MLRGMSKNRVHTPHRTTRDAKRFRAKDRWGVQIFDGPPLGPDVVSASVEEVMAAIQKLPEDLNWQGVADRVVPVLPRLRPYPLGTPEPLRVVVPAGISLGFGIDAGPAFLTVDDAMVKRWGVAPDTVLERAVRNVDRLIAETLPAEVFRAAIGKVPVAALQSRSGSASTYVLRPQSLVRLFEAGDGLLIAPMRNLLLFMPSNVDRAFATGLFDEIAVQDPNCLAPMAFLLRDGDLILEPLGDPYGRA